MNFRVLVLAAVLLVGGVVISSGVFSQAQTPAVRKAITLPEDNPQLPFTGAILAGNTLYMSGRIGIDPKSGNVTVPGNYQVRILL